MLNAEKTARFTDVTVHLVLVAGKRCGVRAFLMDFALQARSTTRSQAPQQAGDYQLRLETIGAAKLHGHEHVATMNEGVAVKAGAAPCSAWSRCHRRRQSTRHRWWPPALTA